MRMISLRVWLSSMSSVYKWEGWTSESYFQGQGNKTLQIIPYIIPNRMLIPNFELKVVVESNISEAYTFTST